MEERRKFIRLDSELNVNYNPIDNASEKKETISKDVSIGGIRVGLPDKISPGTRIRMEISLPNEMEKIAIVGEVIWQLVQKPGGTIETGIKYIEMNPHDRNKLTNYLVNRLREKVDEAQRALPAEKDNQTGFNEILEKEIRFPGDTSKNISAPDFLIREISLPWDQQRHCHLPKPIILKYNDGDGDEHAEYSIRQYLSGQGVWLLVSRQINPGAILKIEMELPGQISPTTIEAEAMSCQKIEHAADAINLYQNVYQINAMYKNISETNRTKIVRYIYTCRHDYIMLWKKNPPDWL
jgi:c-di-GMP-binding flagellar brake protein YcgR